jgi:hypothetical protein
MRSILLRAAGAGAVLILITAGATGGACAQVACDRIEFVNATTKLEGQSSVGGFGARVYLLTDLLGPNTAIVPYLEHWGDSDRFPEFGIDKASQRDWSLGADARYRFEIGKSWRPYAGGGLSMHFLRSTIERAGQPEIADSASRIGLSVLGGIDLPSVSRIQSSVEVGYQLVSGFNQFKIYWGFGVKL